MARFVDEKHYYFNMFAKSDGMYIKDGEFELKLDIETVNYYLKKYTLQKGKFSNSFRKILCNDGEERFFNREHPEYIESEKAEEISIKDIEIGEILKYRHGSEAVYIGSFYNNGYYLDQRRRFHYFYEVDNDYLRQETNLKGFKGIVGFNPKYNDRLENYLNLLEKKRGVHLSIR